MDIDIKLKFFSPLKSETTPIINKSKLQSILEEYQLEDPICFFADGSKTEADVGTAVIFDETRRLSSSLNIVQFTQLKYWLSHMHYIS